jgi:biotin carboxyl carrier protein
MTFEIEVGDRTRQVSVERTAPGRYRVIVDGVAHEVDAARVGEYGLSLLLDGNTGVSREVQIAPAGIRGELLAGIDGRTVTASVNARRTGRASADGIANADGEQRVVAPMSGRVVRVLVSAGDEVGAGQGVVVVEAMKMENELRSPKAGRVKDVAVAPGTSVEAGRLLIVIE